ncbi:MAG: TonB-dependent receptor [Bacteroidetes bacterium]|nr:MAG: TonB-dependent receptor [Bacteroidota bacterium]
MILKSRYLLLFFTGLAFISNCIDAQTSMGRVLVGNDNVEGGTLSGQVSDKEKGNPLAGASVYIPDLKVGTVADSAGHYHFSKLPAGNYLIQVQSVGYKTITRTIQIKGNTIENFELTVFAIEESPVIVTGLSKATQIKRSPVPVVAVNHDYMVSNLSTNIIDAIAKVPGVNALTTGPNVSKPFIRGLGYNRILTLFDGVRQEGQQWGDEHGIEVDQYGVDRVEVIKGPASLSYGSDALAGVVNLIPTQPAPEGKMIGDILAEYQTNNGMFGGSAALGATKKGFEWNARISHKQATNYRNKIDGRVYSTAFNETDAALALGLHRNWGYSHISFSLYNDLQEIPDGSRDSATRKFTKQITEADTLRPVVSDDELKSYTINPLHQHVQHYRIYSGNNFTIGPGRLIVNLGFQNSQRREFSHPESTSTPGLFLQLTTFSYDLKYQLHDFDGWDLSFGVNGMYQDNQVTKGTEFVVPSYHQFDVGPFALMRKSFKKLDLSGGIRFDSRQFHNKELYTVTDPVTGFDVPVNGEDTLGANKQFTNYSHSFSGVSGSIGATYNFTEKFSVKANIARGYRAPNISEISSNGVHPGTNIYQIGNPDFKPEFNFQEDVGMEFSSKYVVISASVFNNHIDNYIFNQKLLSANGGDSVLVPGNQTYKFQQGKADLFGGELSIDIHPIKQLHFENSISVVYGNNKVGDPKLESDSNKYVPFIPPLHGISELRYNFDSKSHHIVNGFVKLQLAYYGNQNRVYLADNTETPTPGYALVNAGAGAGITNVKGKTIVNIYIMANNLFDVAYQDHLSRLKYFEFYPNDPRGHSGIYNMGRNVAIKVDFPLDFDLKKVN